MSANLPLIVPCSVAIGDCSFVVDCEIEYNRIGDLLAIESVRLNGSALELDEDQCYELATMIRGLFEEIA